MSKILPDAITWRIDKKGFEVPQRDWINNPGIIERIDYAKKVLVENKIIIPDAKIDPWKLLMTAKLFNE